MLQFRYRAQKEKSFVKGILSADTRDEAVNSIHGMGFTLMEINEEKLSRELKESPEGLIFLHPKKGRQCRRVASNLPLLFHVAEYRGSSRLVLEALSPLQKLEFHGNEKDISLGGICFSLVNQAALFEDFKKTWGDLPLEEILEPGSILELKMTLPNGKGPGDCVAKARIIRTVYSKEATGSTGESLFLVGAIFLPMDAESKKRLIAFCEGRIGNP